MKLPVQTQRERAFRLFESESEPALAPLRPELLRFSRNLTWSLSQGQWSALVRRWHDRPDQEFERGRVLLRIGLADMAVSPLAGAARRGGAHRLELYGEALAASGSLEQALEPLERALAIAPGRFWARLWRAECLRRLGRRKEAANDIAAARRLRPRSPWPYLIYGRPGDLDAAVARAPREAWLRLIRGWGLLERGRMKAAMADLNHGLARAPFCRWGFILRARARLGVCDDSGARADIETALKMGPDLGTAKRAWRPGDLRGGERRALDKAISRRPGEGWLRAWRGQLGYDELRPRPALEDLRRAVLLDPSCGWARAFRARAEAVWLGEREAERELTQAFSDAPGCAWILLWRGLLRGRRGDKAGAGRDFAAAAGAHPDYALSRGWVGERRRSIGDAEGALKEYDAACELDPDYGFHFERRRKILWSMGLSGPAFDDMEAAVRRESRFRWAHGKTPGDLSRADAELGALLNRMPESVAARAWRGETRLQAGDLTSAGVDLDAAIAARPESPWPRAWRAELSLLEGNPRAALAHADSAIAGDRRYARAWGARARALSALGRRAAAIAAFNRVIELDFGAAWAYGERAQLLLAMGKESAAARDLERAQALDPGLRARTKAAERAR